MTTTTVYAAWNGGPNYSPAGADDASPYPSLSAVREEMQSRADNRYGMTPCVTDDEMTVWRYDPRGVVDPYPDLLLTRGPRGGIRQERA
jgi:hypothetical protein